MEYVHGKTLKELILEKAPFSNAATLAIVEQVALALSHAHENGIIHKDIKPQNILIKTDGDEGGYVKVTDFGIADRKNSLKISEENFTMGSVHYISPEGASNDPVDARSDLYSLGITMYEMLTGELPFDSDDPDEIPQMHRASPFPNIAKKRSDIFPMMREVLTKLVSKPPHKRYQTATQLYNDVKRAIMEDTKYREHGDFIAQQQSAVNPNIYAGYDEPAPPPRKQSPPGRTEQGAAKNPKKDRMVIIGGIATAVVVLALIGIGIFWLLSRFGDQEGYATIPSVIGHEISWVTEQLENSGLNFSIQEEYHDTVPLGHVIDSNVRSAGAWNVEYEVELLVSLGSESAQQVVVPDISGMSIAAAVSLFADLPISLNQENGVFHQTVPENHIISQNPEAGASVPHGTTIYVYWSQGPQTQMSAMPNIIALTDTAARSQILQNNLVVGTVTAERSEAHPVGTVIRQHPQPGTQLHPGSSVDFVLSDGLNVPDTTGTVPDATGTTPPETTSAETTPPEEIEPEETTEIDDPNDPTEPEEATEPTTQPQQTVRRLTIFPPGLTEEPADVRLYRISNGSMLFEASHTMTQESMAWIIDVSGTGTIEFVVTVNGANVGSQFENFN